MNTYEELLPDTERDIERIVEEAERLSHPSVVPVAAVDLVAGMAAGAAVGALAGPPGLVAGAVIGAAAGAMAGAAAMDDEDERRRHDEQLDVDIGVDGGRIGEARPGLPPPLIGAFSRASMGAGGGEAPASEGPIQALE